MSILPICLDDIVERGADLVEAEIQDEVVVIKRDSGACYCLNEIGARVWNLLSRPTRISDVCTALMTEYRVETSVCERQVLDLLEELRAEGLIAKACLESSKEQPSRD